MRIATFNTGSDIHLLDHIAPLAEILDAPLIVTEEDNERIARIFYPHVNIQYRPNIEYELKEIACDFDALIECKYWQFHLKQLFKDLFQKEMRLIFCPHGQSDKGYQEPLLAPYSLQDCVLIYGELMLEMLEELNIPISNYAVIGNYRLAYYRKYQTFYDEMAQKEFFSKFDSKKPTLLYAPTWNDADYSSSFFREAKRVRKELEEWNLIVKVHPLLEQRDPAQFYTLAKEFEGSCLLVDFPPVYPILSRIDAYLGDSSSVGYDCLAFQKPLFFFPGTKTRLRECGTTILEGENIAKVITASSGDFERKRTRLFRKAFEVKELSDVKKEIFNLLKSPAKPRGSADHSSPLPSGGL